MGIVKHPMEVISMNIQRRTGAIVGAIAAISMMAVQISPTSAFTLSSTKGGEKILSPQIEKVWCSFRCGPGWGWRGGHWGFWGPAAVVGAVAAGAVVGAAVAGRPCGPGYHLGPQGRRCWPN
jgi:hypothetical protein